MQPRVATRELLEFDVEDTTFKKTKEDFQDEADENFESRRYDETEDL